MTHGVPFHVAKQLSKRRCDLQRQETTSSRDESRLDDCNLEVINPTDIIKCQTFYFQPGWEA